MARSVKVDILICTIDEGINGIGEVLMPPMSEVHYVVSMQHTRPLNTEPSWNSVLASLRQRPDVTVTTIEGRGLSRNRNNALRHATADILLIADDDCRYVPTNIDAILRAYETHHEADVICFEAQSYDEKPMKCYPNDSLPYDEAERVGYFPTSMEITLRRKTLEHSGVTFNEHFGLGTPLPAGEEDILITDLQRAGLHVMFVPEVITMTDPVTTGDHFLQDNRLQVTKGAVFRYRYGLVCALWRTLKEGVHHLIYNHVNPLPIWLNMLRGIWK